MLRQPLNWHHVVHVTFMSLAWLFLAPFALIVARLRHHRRFSPLLTRTSFTKGKQDWFLLHRNLLSAAVLLTAAGSLVMLEYREMKVETTHGIMGVLVLSIAVVQARLGHAFSVATASL